MLGGGIAVGQKFVFAFRVGKGRINGRKSRDELTYEGQHGAGIPQEKTGVPQKFATRHKLTGEFERRFLGEGFEREAMVAEVVAFLDVAIGRVGAVCRHAHG